ncbi:MAG: endolytic transglycosylase MltG [Pseudomonadota bacterium]
MKHKLLKLMIILIILVTAVLAWYWADYQSFLHTPVKNQKAIKLLIKPGSHLGTIAQKLQNENIISSVFYFKLYAKQENKATLLQAGEYIIKPDISINELLMLFVKGLVTQYQLTIPEGWTIKQILAYLKTTDLEQTINNLSVQQIITKLGLGITHLEGYIYPDTYFFPKQTSDIDFLKRGIKKMQSVLAMEWKNRQEKLPLKSAYETLILASIVEKESGQKSERAKIAGVFIQRLNKGMRLQSDPTIIYGMGDAYKGNIRKKDINKKTRYNTYKIVGLPPGPIASPGQHAIHAVLHPDSGTSLYFVADGSGGHYFSKSLKEHNKAVRKYILKR